VSSEGPVSDYVRRARRVAEQAGRTAAAPIAAVRRTREELEQALADLRETRVRLTETRAELDRTRAERDEARAERDGRRTADAVERVIGGVGRGVAASAAGDQTRPTAPELRDLALAVGDLDENHTPGLVVVLGDGAGAAGQLIAQAASAERVVVITAEPDELEVDEPVALGYVGSTTRAAVTTALQRLAPLLVSGGRLVVEGYDGRPEPTAAVDEYFRDRHMDFRFEQHHRRHVVRR
jgi:hypothetical protein